MIRGTSSWVLSLCVWHAEISFKLAQHFSTEALKMGQYPHRTGGKTVIGDRKWQVWGLTRNEQLGKPHRTFGPIRFLHLKLAQVLHGIGHARVLQCAEEQQLSLFCCGVGGMKMRLNLGLEFYGCFVLWKLWRRLYSDLGVLGYHLPVNSKLWVVIDILPKKKKKSVIFSKSGNLP